MLVHVDEDRDAQIDARQVEVEHQLRRMGARAIDGRCPSRSHVEFLTVGLSAQDLAEAGNPIRVDREQHGHGQMIGSALQIGAVQAADDERRDAAPLRLISKVDLLDLLVHRENDLILLERFSLKTLATVAAAAAVAGLAAGFAIDARGFLGNLLAELVGIVSGALLAIFIVERILERERSRKWDLVSEQTIATLRFALVRAGHHVYLLLPVPRDPDADPYTLGLLQKNRLADALSTLAASVRKRPDLEIEGDVAKSLEPHLELIRGGVMPQLVAIGKHDLIARLAVVESAFQDLQHTIWLNEKFGHLNKSSEAVATLVDSLAQVSEVVDASGDGDPGLR
jgi:hypothetical protein